MRRRSALIVVLASLEISHGFRSAGARWMHRGHASTTFRMMEREPPPTAGVAETIVPPARRRAAGGKESSAVMLGSGGTRSPSVPGGWEGGMAVLLLLLLFTANQWARSLIFYVVDFKADASAEAARAFMNVDIGFDEAQYGVLASIGFAALFSITSLVAGGLVERVDSRNLLAGTALFWSAATAWQGVSHSFAEVLGCRMLSGVGQAFGNPASYTILSRLYPPDRLASANGLYASGVYFGGGLASLSILLDQAWGWRALCVLVGGVGAAMALALLLRLPPLPPDAAPLTPAPPPPPASAAAEIVLARSDLDLARSDLDLEGATLVGRAGRDAPPSESDETSGLLHFTPLNGT